MFSFLTLIWIVLFLTGAFLLTALTGAFRRVHQKDAERIFKSIGKRFFYRYIHRFFFKKHEYEGLFFAILCAQHIARFAYATGMLVFLADTEWFKEPPHDWLQLSLSFVGFVLLAFIVGDYIPRLLGAKFPETVLRVCAPFASPYLLLALPFTYLFSCVLQLTKRHTYSYLDPAYEPIGREEIIEMIKKANISPSFDIHDKKLMESVVNFKERIAREVMVPRVNVFSLSADTTIKDAAKMLAKEGYSRTPVYRNTVDNIVGVLMYKDVLKKYIEYVQKGNDPKVLEEPIESIQKNILHTPETKKLFSLLQEFRKKQVHLAIVVDEYGGTEGIVTIEDILEEIVGDIADEYDLIEEEPFYPLPDGSWIVDPRMTIADAEEELGIVIPQEGEYDTIGGYIFHTTGTIPARGFEIHSDQFDLEILESNDRSVDKVRIKPIATG